MRASSRELQRSQQTLAMVFLEGEKMSRLTLLDRTLTGNGEMVNATKLGAPVLPVATSVKPELVLLDATETGTKAKDLETKLHQDVQAWGAASRAA
jgi:hypothetical protein